MAGFLTLNAFLLDIRLFGLIPVYRAAPHIAARLAALPHALAGTGADVVLLQEVFRRPHRRFLADAMSRTHPHAAGVDHPGRPLGTGLQVLSRHPIARARAREFRAQFPEERLVIRMGVLDCVIDLPDLGRTRVIDFHCAAGGLGRHPESAGAEAVRGDQIWELLALAGDGWAGACDAAVLAGDMNAGPETSAANYARVLDAGFRDAVAEAAAERPGAPPPMTWDPANPLITGAGNRSLPAQRIDHVLFGGDGGRRLRVEGARVVLDDARVPTGGGRAVPVSDHYGLLAWIGPGA